MAEKPVTEFGKRRPAAVQPAAPVKRSRHVALLLTGTLAIGGSAYALMPSENCAPSQPGVASTAGCTSRGSSSSGHGYWGGSSRYGSYSGDSSSSRSGAGAASSEAGSGGVTRGGFGSFAHAFTAHFSGGG
jgi:hypothetical protein